MNQGSWLIPVCVAVVLLGFFGARSSADSGSGDLVAAVRAGDLVRVQKLLDEGVSPNCWDEGGIPALGQAASAGNAALVKLLLSKGADVNATSKSTGKKLPIASLPIVWYAASQGSAETLRLILQAGASANAREGGLGMTPLMAAASFGNTETLRVLIDAKVDLEARDQETRTALMWAADAGRYETARLLLDAGAQVDALGELGSPPLMYAAQHGFDDVVALLVERGADVNRKATPGLTALDLAKQNKQSLTVQLLENGGRQEPPGSEFRTLRPMLYPESPLEAVWLNATSEDKTVEAARQLATKGELRRALDLLEAGREEHQGKAGYWFPLAYLQRQTGDRAAALGSLRTLLATPGLGARETLRVWTLIRSLGEAPPADQSKRVLGVIVESGIGSSVLSIAAYADGQPRYFLSTGGGVIGETWTAEETGTVQEIVHLAQELVDGMAPTEDRTLPKPGRVRFTVLTPGGSFGDEDSFSTLSQGQGRWAKVFAASDKLVGLLDKHAYPETTINLSPRRPGVRADLLRFDDVGIVRLAELEEAGGEPGDGEGGDGAADRDEGFDGGDVAQRLKAGTVEDEPDDRRREGVEREVEQVDADDQREGNGAHRGEEIGVRRHPDLPQLADRHGQDEGRQHQRDEGDHADDLEDGLQIHDKLLCVRLTTILPDLSVEPCKKHVDLSPHPGNLCPCDPRVLVPGGRGAERPEIPRDGFPPVPGVRAEEPAARSGAAGRGGVGSGGAGGQCGALCHRRTRAVHRPVGPGGLRADAPRLPAGGAAIPRRAAGSSSGTPAHRSGGQRGAATR